MSIHDWIFPTLKDKRWGSVDLNAEATQCFRPGKFPNPLLDFDYFQDWLQYIHRQYDIDFSYGGYGEDRSLLWRGTYLDSKDAIHLGVDVNVPAYTAACAIRDSVVIEASHDKDQEGGWGGRIIFRLADEPYYYLYAHLDPDKLPKVGDCFKQGDLVGFVGESRINGGWYTHLHVQSFLNEPVVGFDGYGNLKDLDNHPDPWLLCPTALHDFRRWNHALQGQPSVIDHWSYRKIVGYGEEMIPVLDRWIRSTNNPKIWWLFAMHQLTGEKVDTTSGVR